MALFKIGDALKQFVQSSKIKNGIRAAQIEEVWAEIMGVTIAKYTNKIYIFDKIYQNSAYKFFFKLKMKYSLL
jgi:hypothetical protein